jgi:hypothetical protein
MDITTSDEIQARLEQITHTLRALAGNGEQGPTSTAALQAVLSLIKINSTIFAEIHALKARVKVLESATAPVPA